MFKGRHHRFIHNVLITAVIHPQDFPNTTSARPQDINMIADGVLKSTPTNTLIETGIEYSLRVHPVSPSHNSNHNVSFMP